MGTGISHSSDAGIYVLSDCNICDRIYGSRKRCRSMEKVRYQLSEKIQIIILTIFISNVIYRSSILIIIFYILRIQSLKRSSGDVTSQSSVTEDGILRRTSLNDYQIVPGTPRRNAG